MIDQRGSVCATMSVFPLIHNSYWLEVNPCDFFQIEPLVEVVDKSWAVIADGVAKVSLPMEGWGKMMR